MVIVFLFGTWLILLSYVFYILHAKIEKLILQFGKHDIKITILESNNKILGSNDEVLNGEIKKVLHECQNVKKEVKRQRHVRTKKENVV